MNKLNVLRNLSILLLFMGIAIASGEEQEDAEKKVDELSKSEQEVPLTVSSVELYEAYQENEISADEKYKDHVVQVAGKVIDIRKNSIDENELIVKLNGLVDNEYEIMGISFYFDGKHASEIAKLKKGSTVTIQGLCSGSTMGVNVKGCTLVN